MIRRYAQRSLPDFLLCVAIAVSLCACIVDGFYIPAQLADSWILPVAFSAAACALLFAAAYSRRTIRAGALLLVLACATFALWARSAAPPGGDVLRDAEDNPVLYFLLMSLVPAAVFLLTR
ncbi:MAG: hypothetical protein LBD12_00270, partial [Clostridiales Family XIII bacterium]|nr:hypothetical protein [Clostridiales Family XIII bacterium]